MLDVCFVDFVSLEYLVAENNPIGSPRNMIHFDPVSVFELGANDFVWSHGKG